MVTEPALDLQRGLAACGGNADLHRQLARVLATDINSRIDQLAAAVTKGDLVNAHLLAHRNRGACATIGAMRLAALFSSIETAGRAGDAAVVTRHTNELVAAASGYCAAVTALS